MNLKNKKVQHTGFVSSQIEHAMDCGSLLNVHLSQFHRLDIGNEENNRFIVLRLMSVIDNISVGFDGGCFCRDLLISSLELWLSVDRDHRSCCAYFTFSTKTISHSSSLFVDDPLG